MMVVEVHGTLRQLPGECFGHPEYPDGALPEYSLENNIAVDLSQILLVRQLVRLDVGPKFWLCPVTAWV